MADTTRRHREKLRIILPDGTWINYYADGEISLNRYNSTVAVTEVMSRGAGSDDVGGAQVHMRFEQVEGMRPRAPKRRKSDIVIAAS